MKGFYLLSAAVRAGRKVMLRLAAVVLLAMLAAGAQARNVGDMFIVEDTDFKTLYRIISIDPLEVEILDIERKGSQTAITFPATVNDSTNTTFNVVQMGSRTAGAFKDLITSSASKITTITLPEGVRRLPFWSFQNYSALTTLNLPSTLEEFSVQNHKVNNKKFPLKTINFPNGSTHFKMMNSALYTADGTTLVFLGNAMYTGTTYTFPDGVTTVPFGTIGNTSITKYVLPASMTKIELNGSNSENYLAQNVQFEVKEGNEVFSVSNGGYQLLSKDGTELYFYGKNGDALSVYNDENIKVLHPFCFSGANITNINLPNLKTIKGLIFYMSDNVKTFYINEKLETIEPGWLPSDLPVTTGPGAYMGYRSGLTKYVANGNNEHFAVDANGVLYTKDYKRLLHYPTRLTGTSEKKKLTYTVNAQCEVISQMAFARSANKYTEIIFPAGLKKIEYGAFCRSYFSKFDFSQCTNLDTIGARAFEEICRSTDITLPASVEFIGDSAFHAPYSTSYTDVITTITISANSKLKYIGKHAFAGFNHLTTFQFASPESHAAAELKIDDSAFQNDDELVGASAEDGFVFPASTTYIGASAFNGCSKLTQAKFLETPSIHTIGANSFQNCGLTSITIPPSVTRIENEAFNSCQQLTTATIPASATYVGPQAFLFCGKLTDINVDKDNTKYSSVNGMLASKDKKTLYTFPAGKAATYYTMLSPSFETINDSAFYYCRQLKSVTLPKNVKSLGTRCFAACDNLERINFLSDHPLTDVHDHAFLNLKGESILGQIDLWVRNGHKTEFENSAFWGKDGEGNLQVKSISEAFLVDTDKNGDGVQDGNVEYFPVSGTDAAIVDVQSDVYTFVVPETVPDHSEYSVKLIGDYAFEKCTTDIEEVVVPRGVSLNYIGARAFIKDDASSKVIKNIFIVEDTPTELASSAFGLDDPGVEGSYHGIGDGQKIFVKKSACEAYKAAWPTLEDKVDYKIPGISITNTYGTLIREFDVDLNDYYSVNNSGRVLAYVGTNSNTFSPGTGDGNVQGTWTIGMSAISGSGTYIPAYTAVLLKSTDGAATPTASADGGEYYYTIGENASYTPPATSVLKGITVKAQSVADTNKDIYVMSGGVFKALNGKTVASFPIHKGYMQLSGSSIPGANSNAKIQFTFDDGGTTAIDDIFTNGTSGADNDTPVYDLQGRRVLNPQKGIYIRNGKKVVVK